MDDNETTKVGLTADIVAAYVSKNTVTLKDLPDVIASVHASLTKLGSAPEAPEIEKQLPAVSIRKSVTREAIICLEDGKAFKSLKRHLGNKFGMTPDQYRTKWGLPPDYPMVAPAYAEARSQLAKASGLGRSRAANGKPKRPAKAVA
jgi:predicted transcriptional regulator